MSKKNVVLIIGIVLLLFTLFACEVLFFSPIAKTPTKKEILYNQYDSGVLERIDALEIPKTNVKSGKTTSSLYIDASNVGKLPEYAKVESLTVNNVDISALGDINGLQVYSLSLENVKNFDLSFLDTSRMTHIGLYNSTIQDIQHIGRIPQLESITLKSMQIENVDFLSDLNKLRYLNIVDCNVNNLSAIGKLQILDDLSITNCGLNDISFLQNCEVEYLDISNNKITDISAIYNMDKLEKLDVSNNKVKGKVDISNLKKLRWANMRFNEITDISPNLSSLYSLDLSYNNIKTINSDVLTQIKQVSNNDDAPLLYLFGNIPDNFQALKGFDFICFSDEKGVSFTYEEYEQYIAAIKNITTKYVDASWSETKKAIAVYDYISKNVEYDYALLEDDPFPYSGMGHTEYGALVKHKAVCDGLSFAYRDVLRYLGIECMVYHGDLNSLTDHAAHAWSVTKIEGNYYHCDLTMELGVAKYVDDIRFFGESDSMLLKNKHFLIDKKMPKCTNAIDKDRINEIVQETRKYAGIGVTENEE